MNDSNPLSGALPGELRRPELGQHSDGKPAQSPYHRWLCKARGYCEDSLVCFNDPKVVRKVNGQDRTFCYQHDPENGYAEYLNELENLSGDQLRKDAGGFGVPVGEPNETSAATAILHRGDCDSNGPATLQTLNSQTAQNSLDDLERRNAHDALLRQPSPDERDNFEGPSWRETPADID